MSARVGPLGGLVLLLFGCAPGAMSPAARAAAAPRLLLVGVDADPRGLGGNPGALFEIDPATRAVKLLFTSRELTDPVDVLDEPDGSLLLLDLCQLGGEGRLWRIAADLQSVARVAASAPLVDPTAMARAPDGSLWIADRGEKIAGAAGPGAVFRLSPDLSRCELVVSGPPLAAPSDLCFVDGRALVLDADAFRHDIAELSEGGLFRVDAERHALATVAELHLVSPLSIARLTGADAGSFLITDVNADPGHPQRLNGGVFRLDAKGKVELFAQHPEWRDPSCGTLFGSELLVVDGSADPLKLGDDPVGVGFSGKGRGGVWAVDLATRAVRLFCASPDFVNPARLRVAPCQP